MAKTNFQAWIDSADMPERNSAGQWVDLETGLLYKPTAPRANLSTKAQDARAVAKFFGGKALTGTAAQKEWAEKIRAEKLGEMTQDQAEMACDPAGLLKTAKFWIEQRAKSGQQIGDFVMEQKALLKTAKSLRAAGKSDEYAATAATYNALTTVWGF